MRLSPRKNGVDTLFKEVWFFKVLPRSFGVSCWAIIWPSFGQWRVKTMAKRYVKENLWATEPIKLKGVRAADAVPEPSFCNFKAPKK